MLSIPFKKTNADFDLAGPLRRYIEQKYDEVGVRPTFEEGQTPTNHLLSRGTSDGRAVLLSMHLPVVIIRRTRLCTVYSECMLN